MKEYEEEDKKEEGKRRRGGRGGRGEGKITCNWPFFERLK